ncbi:MAG: hypothetical protein WD638_09970 [Nitriliruptoraceae bacterium]
MDRTERLTSYLDGELGIDERRALEAELAEDAALRAELRALEHADGLLRAIPPTALPDGARQRFDEALAPVLRTVVGGTEPGTRRAIAQAPTTSEAMGGTDDELARRRERRRGLLPALAGVAAAAAVIAVGLTTVGPLGQMGGDDAGTEESADSMSAMDTDDAGEGSAEVETAAAPEPVIIDDGRRLGEEELDELLAADELREITSRNLDQQQGTALARDFQQQLLTGTAPGVPEREAGEEGAEDDSADDGADADDDGASAEAPPLTTRDGRTLTVEDAEAVTRCLSELLTSGEQAVPVTVELLEVDGVAAISFGLVTLDPETAEFIRTEVWTLARSDCQVLRFAQS